MSSTSVVNRCCHIPRHLDCFMPKRKRNRTKYKSRSVQSLAERAGSGRSSLLGFVWPCQVLLWDCELQPSACLEPGKWCHQRLYGPNEAVRWDLEALLPSVHRGQRSRVWEMPGGGFRGAQWLPKDTAARLPLSKARQPLIQEKKKC